MGAAQSGSQPVAADGSGTDPLVTLVAFDRVHLLPGQWVVVPLPVPASAFTRVQPDGSRSLTPDTWTATVEGETLQLRVV